jgi:hypothetical protein
MEDELNNIVPKEDLEYIVSHNKWNLSWLDYFSYLLAGILYLFILLFVLLTKVYVLLFLIVPIFLRFIIGCYNDVRFKSMVTPFSIEENYKLVLVFLQQDKKIHYKQFSDYIVVYPVLPLYRIKTEIVIIPLDKKIRIGNTLSSKYKGFSADHSCINKLKSQLAATI